MMGTALLSWALITLAGGILRQALGPSLIRQATARADREKAARIAAELEARIARRELSTMVARSIAQPMHPDRPYLGPRRRR